MFCCLRLGQRIYIYIDVECLVRFDISYFGAIFGSMFG